MKVYKVLLKATSYASYAIEAHNEEEAKEIFHAMEDAGMLCPYQLLQEGFCWDVDSVSEEEYPVNPITYEEAKEYIEC